MRALGIVLLALSAVWPSRRSLQVLVALCGASALTASAWHASFAGRSNNWAVVGAVVVAVAGGWAAPHAHAALAAVGGAWWVLLGSVVAIYGCVPETDQMREVAVVVAAGGVGELLLRRRLPLPALVAAMAVVEWSALYGATGRARALVGGLFALTPLLAVGVASAAVASVPTDGLPGQRAVAGWLPWAVGAVWVVAAVSVARSGGVATSLPPAVRAAVLGGAAALLFSAVLVRLARR